MVSSSTRTSIPASWRKRDSPPTENRGSLGNRGWSTSLGGLPIPSGKNRAESNFPGNRGRQKALEFAEKCS